MSDAISISTLPTIVPVGGVDLSAFTHALQHLLTRVQALEARSTVIESENVVLNRRVSELSQQALVSQDQYSSLYDSVHEGMSKMVLLQSSVYEKTQAASDLSLINTQLEQLKEETMRLDKSKIDLGSSELEARVQVTATESTSRMLQKFERDTRDWTSHQLGMAEDRILKHAQSKLVEAEARVEQRLSGLQNTVDDMQLKEATTRKDQEAHGTMVVNVLRALTGKLETHEKHLDGVEDAFYSRLDVMRQKFEVFLEHCIGTSWQTLLNGIAVTSTLLPLEYRKPLSEAPCDDAHRRGTTRLRRHMESLREWRRVHTINHRILLGMGDITKKLESSDEQLEATAQTRLKQRRTEDHAQEQQHRNELDGHFQLLGEYMAQYASEGAVDTGILMHPAVEALNHMLHTPLFGHVRASLSKEIGQAMSLTREQFGHEYSNQLAQVNKELQLKATLLGLEDTVREFTQRTLKVQMEAIECKLEAVRSSYVSTGTLMELLSSKADVLVVERKANEVQVEITVAQLRDEMERLNKQTKSDLQLLTMSKITEIYKDMVSKHDPRMQDVLAGGRHGNQHTDGLGNLVVTQSNARAPAKCLSCSGQLPEVPKGQSIEASDNVVVEEHEKRLQAMQEKLHQAQMSDGSGSSARKALIAAADPPQRISPSDGDASIVVATGIKPSDLAVAASGGIATPTSREPPLRLKDWADDVERRFGQKDKKTPRPPSAVASSRGASAASSRKQ